MTRLESDDHEIIRILKEIQARGNPPGIPLTDPSANVLALATAETKRLDDVRTAELRRQDNLRELTAKCASESLAVHLAGIRDAAVAESRRIDGTLVAEARRIDALLAAAASNVSLAAEKSNAQAATLAAQVLTSAETLRAQVATTSVAAVNATTQLRESLEKRLSIVEANQYSIGGQSEGQRLQRMESTGQSRFGIGTLVAVGAVLISTLMLLATVASMLLRK